MEFTITNEDITTSKKFGLAIQDHLQDHDYEIPVIPTLSLLSLNVVTYIPGYVVKMVKRHLKCETCLSHLEQPAATMDDSFLLIRRKDRGGLLKPSQDLVAVCQVTEQKIRQVLIINDNKIPKKNRFFYVFVAVIANDLLKENRLFKGLADHVFDINFFAESHSMILIKLIIKC
ncbi:hypothetical protein FQR65_LT14053 [Abscondita terminalis]|nr:hypothetical protein FQR65_LT14053 [Abscondita terminalis]